MYRTIAVAVLGLGLAGPATVYADLTVNYRATHSELVLFNQPQEAPFAQVQYTLYVSGTRVRTEMVDALGHPWWFVADRQTGKAYSLDPVRKLYWREQGAWSCEGLDGQVAAGIARLMRSAGVQDLDVSELAGAKVGGVATRAAAVHFTGRILGSPQPVATEIDIYFPQSEEETFGSGSVKDLYCGQRPSPAQWAASLQRWVGLDAPDAAFVGGAITVPMRISVRANLGVGQAGLTLEAVEISREAVAESMFELPDGFEERK